MAHARNEEKWFINPETKAWLANARLFNSNWNSPLFAKEEKRNKAIVMFLSKFLSASQLDTFSLWGTAFNIRFTLMRGFSVWPTK